MKYNDKMNKMILGIGESTMKLMQQTSYTSPEKYRFPDEKDNATFRREHYQFKKKMTELQSSINALKNNDEEHESEAISIIMNASSYMNEYMKVLDKLFL